MGRFNQLRLVGARGRALPLKCSVIICAYNEEAYLSACLHSLFAQTRRPDEVIVVDNGSTDATSMVAGCFPGVRMIDEPRRGLIWAREAGRRAALGDVLVYIDADCRAPLQWLERLMVSCEQGTHLAVSGGYRLYDWDLIGRAANCLYGWILAPLVHFLAQDLFGLGAIVHGGNFAVRRTALDRIGGFDTSIEFQGEDATLGPRLASVGRIRLSQSCWVYSSARRFKAMGRAAVFNLYLNNFLSEIRRHRASGVPRQDVRDVALSAIGTDAHRRDWYGTGAYRGRGRRSN
jgi:glycosyltransferase involved in cell wall biosynthesis